MDKTVKSQLSKAYYTPSSPGSFGGVERLQRATGVKSDVIRKWLSNEDPYTLHKQRRTKFTRRVTIVSGMKKQYQVDLMDMQKHKKLNDGFSYILVCIDVFTKMGYVQNNLQILDQGFVHPS